MDFSALLASFAAAFSQYQRLLTLQLDGGQWTVPGTVYKLPPHAEAGSKASPAAPAVTLDRSKITSPAVARFDIRHVSASAI